MPRHFLYPVPVIALVAAWLLWPSTMRESPEATLSQGPGQVVPLSGILAAARGMVEGKVIDVELESDVALDDDRHNGRWVYEVELLSPDGRIIELEFDARTGQLLEIDGAPWPAGVPQPQS